MKRSPLILLAIAGVALAGCTTRLIREGYSVEGKTPAATMVIVKRNFALPSDEATKLGRVRAVDPGFGTNCGEGLVIEMFVEEARRVGADLVNIVNEQMPSLLWSSCYQATAELLRFNDRAKAASLVSDPPYVAALEKRAQTEAKMERPTKAK